MSSIDQRVRSPRRHGGLITVLSRQVVCDQVFRNPPAAGNCHAGISACLPIPPRRDQAASLPDLQSPANASLQDRGRTLRLRPPDIRVPEVRPCPDLDCIEGPNGILGSRLAWRRTQAAPIRHGREAGWARSRKAESPLITAVIARERRTRLRKRARCRPERGEPRR